jgi:hypothetical protein
MRKFSKILESAESDIVLDIRDILMDLKDVGFEIEVTEFQGTYKVVLIMPDNLTSKLDMMECIKDLSVADERIKDLGMSYDAGVTEINKYKAEIRLMYKVGGTVANKDIHGWKEFKSYCEKVLGIEGMEGRDPLYFRINVVDKDSGWPTLPDDKAGWSIEVDGISKLMNRKEEHLIFQKIQNERDRFVAAFPGYEDFLKKLLSRQINYNLVWHLCSDEGDRHHYISDPVKLAESNKNHNPMKFDKEGIEAVETLLEMAQKFPDKIEIKKYNI